MVSVLEVERSQDQMIQEVRQCVRVDGRRATAVAAMVGAVSFVSMAGAQSVRVDDSGRDRLRFRVDVRGAIA